MQFWKSKVLNSECGQNCVLSQAPGENSFPWLSQLLEATFISCLGASSSITLNSASVFTSSLTLILLPPSFTNKDLYDYIGPVRIIQDTLQISNFLHVTSQCLSAHKLACSQVLGLDLGDLWYGYCSVYHRYYVTKLSSIYQESISKQ